MRHSSILHHHSAQVSRSALYLAINFHQAVPACSFWLLAEWEIFTWMARLICGNVDLFSSSPESTLWAKFYIFSTFTCRCQHDLPPWQGVHLMWFCLPPVMWQLHQSGALHQSVCARMLLSTGHGRLPGEVCATITVSHHNKYVGWVSVSVRAGMLLPQCVPQCLRKGINITICHLLKPIPTSSFLITCMWKEKRSQQQTAVGHPLLGIH